MINFEEELKKFHPSLEVEDAEDAIYNQDLTDMADLLVKMIKDAENYVRFMENPANLHNCSCCPCRNDCRKKSECWVAFAQQH